MYTDKQPLKYLVFRQNITQSIAREEECKKCKVIMRVDENQIINNENEKKDPGKITPAND